MGLLGDADETVRWRAAEGRGMSKIQRAACVICLLSLAITLHWLFLQPSETVPGVTSRPLGPCSLDWFGEHPALVL